MHTGKWGLSAGRGVQVQGWAPGSPVLLCGVCRLALRPNSPVTQSHPGGGWRDWASTPPDVSRIFWILSSTTLDPATRVHTSSQRPAALTHISLRAGPTRTTPGPCEVTSDQSFGPTCAPCPSLRAVTTRARALASTGFSSGAADVLSNGFRRACVRPATRTWPGGAWGHGQRWGVRSGHMQGLWGPSSARGEGRPPDPAAQRGPNPQLSRQGSRAAFRGRGREQPDGGTTAQRGSHGAKTSVIRK